MKVASNLPATLGMLAAVGLSQAQYLVNELSFGMSGRMGNAESPDHIPHFIVSGQPSRPDILSNKVILTPISPGNQRGSIWGERTLQRSDWVADVDFRASGPDRASGNLNIWLAKEGGKQIGTNSIYTVGKFEGLALVVDQHGGSGGMLRGFLNDGSVDYSRHGNIDSLAFGHCRFAYRNLGRPAQIKFQQNQGGLKVEVDGRACFESNKITIPQGYNFGVTAATPENPDSFEIFKLVVMSESLDSRQQKSNDKTGGIEYATQQQIPKGNSKVEWNGKSDEDAFANIIPDQDADIFQTSKTQFQDLHNRLQSTYHQIGAIYRAVSKHHDMDEGRHHEVQSMIKELRTDVGKLEKLSGLERKVQDLQRDVGDLKDEIRRRLTSNDNSVRGLLSDHHRNLQESMPSHGKLIFILIGSQVVIVMAYVMYMRRKETSAKKYL